MKRKFARYVVVFILCMLGTTGCSNSTPEHSSEEMQTNNLDVETDSITDNSATALPEKDESSDDLSEESEDILKRSYEMTFYTEVPNPDSSIKIQYPVFSGDKAEEINTLILTKVQDIAQLDPLRIPKNPKRTFNYQAAVTLQNSKIISIVFWGTSDIEGSQFPTTELYSLNIDMQSLKLITFTDLYTVNEEFEKIFLEKALFPGEPVTSFDEERFPEMMKYRTPEYRLLGSFGSPTAIQCFLKPEGIVLSLDEVHASGSDHFEAELLYSDIQEYYLPEKIYWEE